MKLNFLKDFRISTILICGFAAMLLLMVAVGVTAFWSTSSMNKSLERVYVGVPIISGLGALKSDVAAARAYEATLLAADPQSDAFIDAWDGYWTAFDSAKQNWDMAKGTVKDNTEGAQDQDNEEAGLIAKFEGVFLQWVSVGNKFAADYDSVEEKDRQPVIENLSGSLYELVDSLAALDKFFFEDSERVKVKAQDARKLSMKVLIGVCSVGFLAAVFLALGITRIITKPLHALSSSVSRMADGNLNVTLNAASRTRELALLMTGFSAMLSALRDQVSSLADGANTIAVSTSQISTTATELASTASEASISVNQITTTAEEVKQTVQLSTEKANQVAEAAEEVARVADQGRKATEDAVSGMSRIKEEMEYIAESIVKLSEQTQSIGEIIDAVNDLANESNLLSVNASIEAAKAGEFGKGFAVVAQEVKSLSDQSKQATAQVRTILNDIQNATSQAVLATERGSKAVDAGVDLASSAGQSIRALAASIADSAKSAAQIAASSRQQLAGMDQLAQAMASIQDAAAQNVEGAKRLEDATRDLSEIADTLKVLSNRFQL